MPSCTFLIPASRSLRHLLIILLIQCLLFSAQYPWHSNLWGPDTHEYHLSDLAYHTAVVCIWKSISSPQPHLFVIFSSFCAGKTKICSRGSEWSSEGSILMRQSLIVQSKRTSAYSKWANVSRFIWFFSEIHCSWLGSKIVFGQRPM